MLQVISTLLTWERHMGETHAFAWERHMDRHRRERDWTLNEAKTAKERDSEKRGGDTRLFDEETR